METESNWDLAAMRDWSEAFFGKAHRLAVYVLAANADQDELYAQAIATVLSVGQQEAGKHLDALRRAGLLKSVEKDPTDPEIPLKAGRPPARVVRTDDELWDCLRQLGERFRREPPPGNRIKD